MTRHRGREITAFVGGISTQQLVHPKIRLVVWPLDVTVDLKHNRPVSITLKEAGIYWRNRLGNTVTVE